MSAAIATRSVSNRRHMQMRSTIIPNRRASNRSITGQKRRNRDVSDIHSQSELPSKRQRIQTSPWNPPSTMERRKTRMQYRALADYTDENRVVIADPMTQEFPNNLRKQEMIYEEVGHIHEMYLDVQQSLSMTNILRDQCRKLGDEQFTITPNDYITAIRNAFGSQNEDREQSSQEPQKVDWDAIGHEFALWFLTVPPIQFMNGPLQQSERNVETKKRQIRRRAAKCVAQGPVIKPKKVVGQEATDKTETKSRVLNLTKTLKSKCLTQEGVNPFEFLINPDSYSETIENIFDLSFVVKEGRGQMVIDNVTKQPVLSYIPRMERQRRYNMDGDVDNRQCIVKFNPQTFCNLINVYEIKESQIHREDPSDDESDTEESVTEESEQESEIQKSPTLRRCSNRVRIRENGKEEAD